MDHWKIVVSTAGMSLLLALVILGTGNASALGQFANRRGSPVVSTVGGGKGTSGSNEKMAKPPTQPNGSVSARPNVTVTLGAWRNLRPTESTLNGVSLLPPGFSVDCQSKDQKSQGFAVGDSGVILSYCNGVWDHSIVPQYVFDNLFAVQAISPTLAVAVGDHGAVEIYEYNSIQNAWLWVKHPIPSISRRLNSVSLVKRDDGSYYGWSVGHADPYVGNRGTLILGVFDPPSGSPNLFSRWTNVTANPENSSLPAVDAYYAVHTLSPTDSWAVGGSSSGGVIIHWNGNQWSLVQSVSDPLYGIRMKSASEGWAVGGGGAIYRYNGSSWSKVSSPTKQILSAIDYAPNGEEWIVGYHNAQLKYVGGSWQQVPPENLRTDAFDFRAIDFTSGHGWLVGGHYSKGIGGQILEYDNGLWLAVTPPTDNRLNAIVTVSENDAWAVGAADESGATIIRWDGKHWQRWYQPESLIPKADLYTISMVSATDGWAAGDQISSSGPLNGSALFLHWDGRRWAVPRSGDPVNARINGLDTFVTSDPLHRVFSWAVADTGNAFANYQTADPEYWVSLSDCYGAWYQVNGVSIIPGMNPPWNWDAWAVGKRRNNVEPHQPLNGVFLRFRPGCGDKNAWDWYQDAPLSTNNTSLYGIKMMDGPWGYAVGNRGNVATVYYNALNPISPTWTISFTQPTGSYNPSNFYSVDIIDSSRVPWFGGFYANPGMGNRKWAYISYIDAIGSGWVHPGYILPVDGINIYHRPIRSIDMVSDDMGWAVGDPEDKSTAGGKSVIYQYPYPNFTLDTHPPAQAVAPTGSTTFTVTVNSIGGFNALVSLSLPYPLPTGIDANVSGASIDANHVATVVITTNGATARPEPYCLVLRGSATFRSGDINYPIGRDVCLNLYVTNRPVTSVAPDHGPFGTIATITGSGFGPDPGPGNRSTASNHISWTPTNPPSTPDVQMPDSAVVTWSDAQITFRPPDSPGLFGDFPINGKVKVTAGGLSSNDNNTFKMDPWISNLSKSPGGGNLIVTLTGTSFGNDPGAYLRATDFEHVSLSGSIVLFSSVTSWSNNSIVFIVPTNTPGGSVTVTTNGFESNAVYLSGLPKQFLPLLKR